MNVDETIKRYEIFQEYENMRDHIELTCAFLKKVRNLLDAPDLFWLLSHTTVAISKHTEYESMIKNPMVSINSDGNTVKLEYSTRRNEDGIFWTDTKCARGKPDKIAPLVSSFIERLRREG